MAMSEFCHLLRGRDRCGTLLTSGRRTRCTPAETEKLLHDADDGVERGVPAVRTVPCGQTLREIGGVLRGFAGGAG
jgi:hypothetical protein